MHTHQCMFLLNEHTWPMHLLLRYPAMQVSFDWARGQCLLLFGWACVANACFFWIKPGCLAGSSKNLVCLYAYEDTSSVLKTCLPLYRCTAGQRMLFIIWAYEPGYVVAIKPCMPCTRICPIACCRRPGNRVFSVACPLPIIRQRADKYGIVSAW